MFSWAICICVQAIPHTVCKPVIYAQLESHDKDDTKFRSLEEMAHEANILAELFK